MNRRIRISNGTRRGKTALLAAIVLGIGLVGGSSLAVDFTQPPSAFDIDTDGLFTSPYEWSDVTPTVRLNGESFVYTSADAGLGALYLMYDLPSSTAELLPGLAGPVHFHNGGSTFEVYFVIPLGLEILKDGVTFVPTEEDGELSLEGASGFGPSPNSTTPHNMFELEVLFDGSDTTLAGHSHGQYSPDPSHWGAALPTDPGQQQQPVCVLAEDPVCDEGNDPTGGGKPMTVDCPSPDSTDQGGIRISFGAEVSNACVNVVRGSGGLTQITAIPLPGELVIETDVKPGSNPNCVNPNSGGVISVAYLGSDDLNAAEIDPDTLQWGEAGPVRCNFEDVSGDGFTDLVCKYKTSDVDLPVSPENCVTVGGGGQLLDGTPFFASDLVCVAGDPVCNAGTPQ